MSFFYSYVQLLLPLDRSALSLSWALLACLGNQLMWLVLLDLRRVLGLHGRLYLLDLRDERHQFERELQHTCMYMVEYLHLLNLPTGQDYALKKMIGIYVWTIYKHIIKYENVQVNVSGLKGGSSICKSTEYVYIHSYDTRVCTCTCCLLRRVCADTCLGEYVLIHAYQDIETSMC